ncbi:Glycerophosphodiester phosphodiesterase, putative [Babesia ovata]|uniref:Glycerophosphodiester phosphodiesterase, putative n=1 Tax=Babesia ovata TaxID=189622 RepID=A0A2H6KAF5_9APIC|nr:Glycerophosphodiester phosphodiesterase, putative [Babesia ovata]GBE59981.1 Glycerophosphodiester phosphodiesterase, putative [Babesia ovata]
MLVKPADNAFHLLHEPLGASVRVRGDFGRQSVELRLAFLGEGFQLGLHELDVFRAEVLGDGGLRDFYSVDDVCPKAGDCFLAGFSGVLIEEFEHVLYCAVQRFTLQFAKFYSNSFQLFIDVICSKLLHAVFHVFTSVGDLNA